MKFFLVIFFCVITVQASENSVNTRVILTPMVGSVLIYSLRFQENLHTVRGDFCAALTVYFTRCEVENKESERCEKVENDEEKIFPL